MINLGWNLSLARDGDQLIDCLEQPRALAANMRNVNPVILRSYFRKRYQFLCFRIEAWSVNESRADTQGTLLHRFTSQIAHSGQLRLRRRTVGIADFMNAQRGCADERGYIGRDSSLDEQIEIFAKRSPGHWKTNIALLRFQRLSHFGVERTHRLAFTHPCECAALATVA